MKQPVKAGDVSMSLLGEGKSSRLQAIREKAMGAKPAQTVAVSKPVVLPNNPLERELNRARQLLDQRLESILAGYPAGKRQRFFELRYGISEAQLKQLSLEAAFAQLKLDSKLVDMDLIGNYAYQAKNE